MGATCASSNQPLECNCKGGPPGCTRRRGGDDEDDDDEAALDYSDHFTPLAVQQSSLRHRDEGALRSASNSRAPSDTASISSGSSKSVLLGGESCRDVFGDDADSALDDAVLVCRDLHTQAMVNRLREIAFSEERDMIRSQVYFNVLQQVLDLLVSAVCDVSGGHMWIAVMTEAELTRLKVALLDDGALTDILNDANIQDKPFQKRVWFYKSWVQQFDLPVQGGFVVDRSGKVLAAAVNFLNGTAPLTPPRLARSMGEGAVFARSEHAGVRVYPSADVVRGQAYKVLDALPHDPRSAGLPATKTGFIRY